MFKFHNLVGFSLGCLFLAACGSPSSKPALQVTSAENQVTELGNDIGQVPVDTSSICSTPMPEVVRTVRLADGVVFDSSAITFADISRLILAIPDHYAPDTAAWAFTDEYHRLLRETWEMPSDGLGDIGSEEALFYFVSGQDDNVNTFVVKSVEVADDSAFIAFSRLYPYERISSDNLTDSVSVRLVREPSGWKIADYIADFGSTRAYLRKYILEQRRFFRSEEWKERIREARTNNLSDADAKRYADEVERYFEQHPTNWFGFSSSEPTEQRIREIFAAIPEHEVRLTDSTAFDTSFYALMKHFVLMPNDAVGEKGTKSELYCFHEGMEYCGVFPEDWKKEGISHRFEIDDIWQVSDSQAYACVRYLHLRHDTINYPYVDYDLLPLVKQSGRWVLSDFFKGWPGYPSIERHLGTRWYIVDRIVANRKGLGSDFWKKIVEEYRQFDPEYLKQYMKDYETYFKLYPELYLSESDRKRFEQQ